MLNPAFVQTLTLSLLVMVFSLTVHECAHAFVAYRLGDDTAARQGRLSLSPITHVDPIGTLLVPALGLYFGGIGFIGWARPVPVTPARFSRKVSMRQGMALVAVAGPLSNLLLAILSLALYAVFDHTGTVLRDGQGQLTAIGTLLGHMARLNIALAIFNLLPIPPLDGSRLLPRSFDGLLARIAPFSFILLIALINAPSVRFYVFDAPYAMVAGALETLFRTQVVFR